MPVRALTGAATFAIALSLVPAAYAEVINGDDQDNTLDGTPNADTIDGKGGNDTIDGHDGDDTLKGGDGDDEIAGGHGADTIEGGDGNDTLEDRANADTPESDTFKGGPGNDTITGSAGNDTIDGGGGDDTLTGGSWSEDTIDGGGGNDTIVSGSGGGQTFGGEGDDKITLGTTWGFTYSKPVGYPKWDDPNFDFQRIVGEAYGGPGNDWVRSRPGNTLGNSFFYLDGVEGKDILDGGRGQDLLIGRGGDDTFIGGEWDDYFAIVGNSVEGYTFYDKLNYNNDESDVERNPDGTPKRYNHGDDMLCFIRDVNPQQLTMITTQSSSANSSYRHYMEFNEGLGTQLPVNLDLTEHPQLMEIEAFRTGSGNDTIVGTDRTMTDLGNNGTYHRRWVGTKPHGAPDKDDDFRWVKVQELFFTGGGSDTITTGGGNDLVDAGDGNDTINAGPGEHFLILGGGKDTVNFNAAQFNGIPSTNATGVRCRIVDLSQGDKIVIQGAAVNQISFNEQTFPDDIPNVYAGTSFTGVLFNGQEQFCLLGLTPDKLRIVSQRGGKSVITLKGGVKDPQAPVGPIRDGVEDGKQPEKPGVRPAPGVRPRR